MTLMNRTPSKSIATARLWRHSAPVSLGKWSRRLIRNAPIIRVLNSTGTVRTLGANLFANKRIVVQRSVVDTKKKVGNAFVRIQFTVLCDIRAEKPLAKTTHMRLRLSPHKISLYLIACVG